MKLPLHVTHVVLSLDVGGLERIVIDLLRTGQTLGQRVSVICIDRPGALADEARAAGATVQCVDKPPGVRPATIVAVSKLLRQLRPDVIHTHQIGALLYAGPAARRHGLAVIHTEHGKHYQTARRARLLGRLAGYFADVFCCVSKDVAAAVARHGIVPARKIKVIYNGINAKNFADDGARAAIRASLGIAPDARVIGTLGRLTEIKRQDLLLHAFVRCTTIFPDVRLMLVGDGAEREKLQSLARELHIADRVIFAGYQSSPQRFLRAMDIFALTSRSEGMPLVVLEAWASDLPVVASNVGGLPEMIEPGITGLLFPSGDADALAVALSQLLRDEELARSMASVGRACVSASFTIDQTAANYHELYLSAARAGAKSAQAPIKPVTSGAMH